MHLTSLLAAGSCTNHQQRTKLIHTRMSLFAPAPKPASLLGYHRILSPTAAVRVSPLCLGAMNFGDAWKQFLGECNKETAFAMLDYFYEQGGNFIDTFVLTSSTATIPWQLTGPSANNYQGEESETWIGEWMQKHGNRDEVRMENTNSCQKSRPLNFLRRWSSRPSSPRVSEPKMPPRKSNQTSRETTPNPSGSVLNGA